MLSRMDVWMRSVLAACLAAALAAPPAADAQTPVQVYILMGQSNMLGMGTVSGNYDGTLEYAVNTKGKYQYLVDGTGNWAERTDVRHVRVMSSGLGPMSVYNNEWLNVGSDDDKIGPEYGIGHYLGEAIDAPVLLLKSCIGNRSLGWDLLPPGSQQFVVGDYTYAGYGDSPDRWLTGTTPTPINWYAGIQYDGDVRNAKTVLDNLGTYFPGATDYEVAGFFWWQGDKDRYSDVYADRYEQNLVQLINQLRIEFNAPNANFVLATLGQTQIGDGGNEGDILNAQLAVSDPARYPQFAGNVATVYSHPLSMGGASNSHYNNNAETYMNIGEAMGQAMVSLLRTLPYVTVNQQTGEIRIVNPADSDLAMDFKDYAITSDAGALDPAGWTPITGHYDLAGDGSVDADGNWTIDTASTGQLAESALPGGSDGLIPVGSQVSLGVGAWVQNPTRDLRFTYTDTSGIPRELTVRYIGDDLLPADLNFDLTIDAADWQIFIANAQADLSALSPAQAYQHGDLDGDGDNDILDFQLFRQAYEAANPAPGAFAELLAAYPIPEPGTLALLLCGTLGLCRRPQRRSRPAAPASHSQPPTVASSAPSTGNVPLMIVLAVALACPAVASAVGLSISPTAPAVDGLDIVNLATPTGGQLIWSDRAVQGQTFTTGTDWGTLNAITVQLYESPDQAPIDGWKDYVFRFGQVSLGFPNSFNELVSATVRQNNDQPSDQYFTFTLDSPLILTPDTLYGFEVGLAGSQAGWQSGIPQVRTTGDEYPAGQRFTGEKPNQGLGTTVNLASGDLVFHADIDPVAGTGLLTLRVDRATGVIALHGPTIAGVNVDINSYQVTSAAQSLDPTGWLSLADQDFDGNGPPDGSGNGWEEAGGAGPHALAEAFLLGNSTIAADALVSLGRGYNRIVDAQDLAFSYLTDTGQVVEGLVEYIASMPGDFNGDAQVEQSDLNLLLQNWGASSVPPNWSALFDGLVDQNELNDLLQNWGTGVSGAQALGGRTAVPEPATLGLLTLLAAALPARRNRPAPLRRR